MNLAKIHWRVDQAWCRMLLYCDHDSDISTICFDRRHPLCIQHVPEYYLYAMIQRDFGYDQVQGNDADPEPEEWTICWTNCGTLCRQLYRRLAPHLLVAKHDFQQTAANFRYYHLMMVQEMERLDRYEARRPLVDQVSRERMLTHRQACASQHIHPYMQTLPPTDTYIYTHIIRYTLMPIK